MLNKEWFKKKGAQKKQGGRDFWHYCYIKNAQQERAYTQHTTQEIYDVDRYLTDDYAIHLSLQEQTKLDMWSIGVYVVNKKLGISGYQEYWHYPSSEKEVAKRTYNKINRIVKEVCEDMEVQVLPMSLLKPQLRVALNKVDVEHKERSGVHNYNYYATEVDTEGDWRSTIYGQRYPGIKPAILGEKWINNEEENKEIKSEGKNRSKIMRYASHKWNYSYIKGKYENSKE